MAAATVSTDSPEITDETCGAFRRLPPELLTPGAIHRFVVGEDTRLRVLNDQEAADELGDPFATELLRKGTFPRTAGEVLDAFAAAMPEGDPLRTPRFFLVGDGSQIAFTPETASVHRNLRFLATLGDGPEGADVMLSSFQPDETDVELMAWDRERGGFNYYQTVGDSTGWVFAGNSRHALLEASEDKGPFESHPSGNVVMKELAAPWINWDSPDAPVLPTMFSADDPLRGHRWFTERDRGGAFTLETAVIRPSIVRWTKTRFARITEAGGIVERPERIVRQVVTSPAVNLRSSHRTNATVASQPVVELPHTFFVDSTLIERLGLVAPPTFVVPGSRYAEALATFEAHVTDGETFDRPGDTHFVFLVPERAAEDQAVVDAAMDVGLLTDRLVACLLMTDFANPVFSDRRAALLKHVPARATVKNGASELSQAMADAIVAAAEGTTEGSGEREFSERWETGEDWREAFDALLQDYYAAVVVRLADSAGFDDVFRLAESRRDRVRGSDLFPRMPIAESPLLFARTNVPPANRSMGPDGSVVEL